MNSPIVKFIAKALGFFAIWYLIYDLWLLPAGELDRWISLNIVMVGGGILEAFGFDVYAFGRVIGIVEYPGIEIVDGCNGVAAIGLFLGFIFAYPGDWRNKLSFSLFGVSLIYVVNLLRIITLTITQAYYPSLFDFMHDYSTTTIFYLFIFLLWMIWVNFNDSAISETE
ncbi:exosortase X [Gracilimonas amylolytica]|uniref:exosortase X n=1 Tax=Gracilimonas amylolytica TaxID=1749045 RepID=UPI000CD9AB97|nr:archaeosortase/exosortase family protein [Gracilimonas amylolytica]